MISFNVRVDIFTFAKHNHLGIPPVDLKITEVNPTPEVIHFTFDVVNVSSG